MDHIWSPGPVRRQTANIKRFIDLLRYKLDPSLQDYWDLYHYSIEHPETFWRAVWDFCAIIGKPGSRIVTDRDSMPGAQWFPDARLNFAENLLRYQDDELAIIFRAENGNTQSLSYAVLYRSVAQTAAALKAQGVGVGDRVAGFIPNMPEAIIAMLATTSIGAIWTSCSPDFGISGVVDRFGQTQPKVMFCTDAYYYNGKTHDCLEKVKGIVQAVPSIERVVVIPFVNPQANISAITQAVWLSDFQYHDAQEVEFESLPFNHPLYILYSSGTTGTPKCIVHGAGGTLIQHLKELVLHTNVRRVDRICYFTTCSWMMWNWLASNLATGATVVLYDGSPFYPSPETMFDLVDELDITILGTSAKSIRRPRRTRDGRSRNG